jgi:hypothetical protein
LAIYAAFTTYSMTNLIRPPKIRNVSEHSYPRYLKKLWIVGKLSELGLSIRL